VKRPGLIKRQQTCSGENGANICKKVSQFHRVMTKKQAVPQNYRCGTACFSTDGLFGADGFFILKQTASLFCGRQPLYYGAEVFF